ncbi:MAG: phosphohydrolase [Methylophaga sp.]|nr:MAG: phosphohydrolase [Methylophaga sp.]
MALTPDALVNKSLELVSPPNTYTQLDALMQDPNSSADDISAVINTDPALATRLLKVVNSPFYGFPSQISTISRAITIIGTRELIHLVLATSVINAFSGIPSSLINMTEFWRHSLATAVAAKYLAKACGHRATEQFFIAGLLHNIGSLILYQSVPELAREAINSSQFGNGVIYEAEQRVLGFNHTHVGQELIKAWRLPKSLEEAARYHHDPSSAEEFAVEVAVVHIADILCSAAQLGHSGDNHVPPLDPAAWDLLNLNEDILSTITQQVVEQVDVLTALLVKH